MSTVGLAREDRSPRRVTGAKIRAEVLGEPQTKASSGTPHLFDTLFVEFTEDFCWGNIWSRPGLSRQIRSMLNLAMLAALGRWHEFEVHTRGALNNGVSEEEIGEILLQAGVYAGIPVAAEGLRRAKAVILEQKAKRDKGRDVGLTGAVPLSGNMSLHRLCEVSSGKRIAYSRQGHGPVLVLLHPIGVDRTWWCEYTREWQSSYDVITVDLRGHGESSLIDAPISLSDHASDVAALLEQERVDSAHIIGVSIGGMVAQRMAIEVPHRVASLTLCATAGGFPDAIRSRILARGDVNRAGVMSEVVDDTIARWFRADSPRPDLVQRCRTRLLADDWYSWSANWAAISRLDNLAALRTVAVPTLVVAGEADASIAPASSKLIADAIPAAKFVSVPSAAHFGAFEMRKSFSPVFDEFLSGAAF